MNNFGDGISEATVPKQRRQPRSGDTEAMFRR
jgi:hypothetical protein